MPQNEWRIATGLLPLAVNIDSLYKDPDNFNVHDAKNMSGIRASLLEFGQVKPIVVNESGMIVAGNGTFDCAIELGAKKIAVVRIEGSYLTPEQLKLFGISDNATAKSSFFDEAALSVFVEQQLALDPFLSIPGFSPDELNEFAKKAKDLVSGANATLAEETEGEGDGDAPEGDVAEDDFDDSDVPTRVQLGDVWTLGRHRLICGDVTNPENLQALMGAHNADMIWSDPPYGQEYQSNFKKKKFAKLVNDDTYLDCTEVYNRLKDGGAAYICTRWDHYPYWFEDTSKHFKIKNCIIWHKPGGGLGDLEGAYIFNHELIIFGVKGKHILSGKRSADLWEISKDAGVNYKHPTQKPVALSSKAIEKSSPINGRVLVPFGGGGGDVIACERLARNCYVAELEPHFCDVILARWEQETGETAEYCYNTGEGEEA